MEWRFVVCDYEIDCGKIRRFQKTMTQFVVYIMSSRYDVTIRRSNSTALKSNLKKSIKYKTNVITIEL